MEELKLVCKRAGYCPIGSKLRFETRHPRIEPVQYGVAPLLMMVWCLMGINKVAANSSLRDAICYPNLFKEGMRLWEKRPSFIQGWHQLFLWERPSAAPTCSREICMQSKS
jgi:hypothetical protein